MNTLSTSEQTHNQPENKFFYLSSIQRATANISSIAGNFLYSQNTEMMTDKDEAEPSEEKALVVARSNKIVLYKFEAEGLAEHTQYEFSATVANIEKVSY